MMHIKPDLGELLMDYKNNTYFVDAVKLQELLKNEETCKVEFEEASGNLEFQESFFKNKYLEFKTDFDITFEGCIFEGDVIVKNGGSGRINIDNSLLEGINTEYALIVSNQGDIFFKNVCQEEDNGLVKIESAKTVYIGDCGIKSKVEVKAKTLQVLNTSAPIEHDSERFFTDQKAK